MMTHFCNSLSPRNLGILIVTCSAIGITCCKDSLDTDNLHQDKKTVVATKNQDKSRRTEIETLEPRESVNELILSNTDNSFQKLEIFGRECFSAILLKNEGEEVTLDLSNDCDEMFYILIEPVFVKIWGFDKQPSEYGTDNVIFHDPYNPRHVFVGIELKNNSFKTRKYIGHGKRKVTAELGFVSISPRSEKSILLSGLSKRIGGSPIENLSIKLTTKIASANILESLSSQQVAIDLSEKSQPLIGDSEVPYSLNPSDFRVLEVSLGN